MKHRLKLIGVAGAALAPACAASFAPAFAQEWSFDASTTVVGAALDEDGLEGEPLLGNLRLSATATSYLDNGVVLTWSAQGRASATPRPPAFGGVIGPCEATVAGCPAARRAVASHLRHRSPPAEP
ncbi:MAG: hypothetical protein R3C52_15725 [Hyphomonadaceae bacterium]